MWKGDLENASRDCMGLSKHFKIPQGTLSIQVHIGKAGKMFVGMDGHAPEKLALSSHPGVKFSQHLRVGI